MIDLKPELCSSANPIATPSTMFDPDASILDLIMKLRSCFLVQESEQVARILQCREDKLKQTISHLKNRLNSNNVELKNQLQTLNKNRSEKFAEERKLIQGELRKCKAECEAYRKKQHEVNYELEKLRLDSKMWREKEAMSVELCEKQIADMDKELDKEIDRRKEEVDKAREEFAGLIEEKNKAEESAGYWEMRYKQCEPRVSTLEKDLVMMFGSHPVLGKMVKNGILEINPNSGNPESVERPKQSNVSKCDENAHASPCAASTAESPKVDTIGPAETGMAHANRMPTENQVVIMIDDSDEESPIVETTSALKTDKDYGRSFKKGPASQSISKGKHPFVCTQNYGHADGSNKNKKRKMGSLSPDKADKSSDSSDESTTSLVIEKLVSGMLKNKPLNFDADMRTAFDKDDELCLHAVCALHRLDKLPQSRNRGFSTIDATRVSDFAKFLTNGYPQGKLRKSVAELQQYDPKGIDECRKLARNHTKQLFQIYIKEEDPLFMEYLAKNYLKRTIS